jgi:hypothetical protein
MQTEYYKECVQGALKNLLEVNQSIVDSLIPIAMNGELSEWNKSVPVGEVHQFNFELFKSCDDMNIKLLVEVLEKVDSTYDMIKNLNDITLDDE